MKSRAAWKIGGTLALAGAVVAAVLGYEVTGWALVRPSGPTFLDYGVFAGLTAVVAAFGAVPGPLVGLLVSRLSVRGNDEHGRLPPGGKD